MTNADLLWTADQLLKANKPVTLATEHIQNMFTSGKAMRQWATENGLKLTVHKGSVSISSSGKAMSSTTIAEQVMKVGEAVKARL